MVFEQLEHKADLKFKVIAKDLDELFLDITNAVLFAIFEKQVRYYNETKEIIVEGKTTELLIHNYIEELLFFANYEGKMFVPLEIKFENTLSKKRIIAKLGLRAAERKDYNVEVKACSYSVQYEKTNKGLETIFVLDI